jgi:hypothetical protein
MAREAFGKSLLKLCNKFFGNMVKGQGRKFKVTQKAASGIMNEVPF